MTSSVTEKQFVVLWGEEKLDLTKFLHQHPAGPDVLLPYEGKNIQKAFEDIGHSDVARKMVHSFLPAKETESTLESSGLSYWAFVKRKLFTAEDNMLVHKVLGLASLCSFVYRYCVLWPTTGSLGFERFTTFNLLTLLVHWLLSSSSLIFHVLARRNVREPLIIYEEYRLHAILFTSRAVGVTILAWLGVSSSVLITFVLMIHLLVDYVTNKFGTKGVTAVRNDGRGRAWYLKPLRYFYSYYQFLALASHLLLCPELADMGFNTLPAIQSSAFLMTLRRKNIIRWQSHMWWYSVALLASMLVMWHAHGPVFFLAAACCFFLRSQFGLSKYVVWTIFVAAYAYRD